jgi:2'-5' RNA ligase
MRLFTAIDLPEDLREGLRSFLKRLKPLAKLSWSRVENLHITTTFIGEWPEERLDEMKRVLAEAPAAGPIAITVRGLGWFPDERRPRVFWAGIHGGEPLTALAQSTEEAVARLGVPKEDRPFSPHLTLARIKHAVPLDALRSALRAFPAGCGFDFGSFQPDSFFLYRSTNGRYTQLARFPIQAV